jgi:hypothetical protein
LLLADTANAFADAIVKLLTNPSLAKSIRAQAMSFVSSTYGWDSIQKQLLSAYENLVGASGREPVDRSRNPKEPTCLTSEIQSDKAL